MLANPYFRWFDVRFAEAITVSGQLTIRWAEKHINRWMNEKLQTKDVDYVIASDTDSCYINMANLVERAGLGANKPGAVEFIDNICEGELHNYINDIFEELAKHMRCYWQGMHMKREGISDRGIFVAKKRYILNVYNNEGVQYDKPKLKVMGIEAVRSSTPACCRDSLKEALKVILQGTEQQTIEFVDKFRKKFNSLPFEEVAFPRGVNGMDKYADNGTVYKKATPIHVRGALLYNQKLKQMKLTTKYQTIFDREKIKFCYLKLPNPLHENVISCNGKLPKEFQLEQYIDYDLQFEKAFVEPISTILDTIGWKLEETNTVSKFFK